MSGASGKVPAAIHVSPEALPDGPLARVRDGDVIRLCAQTGELEAVGVDLGSRAAGQLAAAAGRHGTRAVRADAAQRRSRPNWARRRCSLQWKPSSVRQIAVADIGGTHARFALAEIEAGRVVSLGEPMTLKTADHASFQLAWQDFGRRDGERSSARAGHRFCRARSAARSSS